MAIPSDVPELEDVIAAFVTSGLAQLHAAIPAIVVAYDPVTQRASCQPTVRKRVTSLLTGEPSPALIPSPPTPPLPVQWPAGGGPVATWGITGPLLPGDPVTLLVRSRSCDEWQATGAPDNVALDPRRWAIQDAVVIPGARPLTQVLPPTAVDPLSLVLYGTPATPVKLGSNLAVDNAVCGTTLAAAASTLATSVSSATAVVGTAPQNAAALVAIAIAVNAFASAVAASLSTTVKVAP